MPVNFDEDRKSFKISSQDGEMIDNLTLRLFLKNDFSLNLPSFPTLGSDEDLIDIEKYLTKVNKFVSKQKGWRVLRRSSVGIFYTHGYKKYQLMNALKLSNPFALKQIY